MNIRLFSFEKLEAYKEARILVKDIYLLLNKFPKTETYALCDQLRRSAVSITSNIAEGSGRNSTKEKIHFLEISFGSMMECFSQLQIAQDLQKNDKIFYYIYKNSQNINKQKVKACIFFRN